MPYSHHSHSGQFCRHAAGTLEDVVREAIRQGFEVYGLTEHVPRYRLADLYPEEEGMSLDALATQFDAFLTEAHRLKAQYAGDITLLVGLETEFIMEEDVAHLETLLSKCQGRIEYLVGSVHHANAIPIDFDVATFGKALDSFDLSPTSGGDGDQKRMEALLCSYFDAQYEVLRHFHPEVVGHVDLCRLYNPTLQFGDYGAAWEKLERNVKYATNYGALFELNAAALRKGWEASYPGEDVAQLILKHGGRFALSDDSHGPHAVGLNYDRMARYVQRLGLDELWVLERSESANVGGRFVQPRKVDGKWWEHPFWKTRGVELGPTA
ncbi:polymerase/histidinol phosphatase-like protein [Rhodofomes roseus]|uniref:Histidinol-phosphatase n=1 Tax=Rhodofomes roseus TaxID=34475 RepID=A0ABQ8KPH0_9APHY|nr:polymerase/histidinol phosphatase-like protein [Rhodofomes roseus]KAH9840211.1 polymerase/histidinol phosphatase-like protein [Rhodofomes roseus]